MMSDGTLALRLLQNQHTAKSPTKNSKVQIVLIWELQRHFCIFLWVDKTLSMKPGIWKWAANTFNDILTVLFQIYVLVLADVPEVRHKALEPLPWQSWTWQWEASPWSLNSVVLHCFTEMSMLTIKLKTRLKRGQLGYTATQTRNCI